MSEAGIITSNPVDGERIRGTVGFPLPGVELRIVDGHGDRVDTGCTGGVEIRGPSLFAGYWRRPDATEAALRPRGWFVTGDVGSVDDEGRLTLQGRAGDMIISGGENVYPKEIELVLDTVPGVRESAVIGLPHPDLGEGVTAIVVATADFDETAARDRLGEELARFKHPKAFVVVDELPRNAMGKVQKHTLRRDHEGLYAG
jgi:malonyl-CoA/methylmalonyl-CoA synthetase